MDSVPEWTFLTYRIIDAFTQQLPKNAFLYFYDIKQRLRQVTENLANSPSYIYSENMY